MVSKFSNFKKLAYWHSFILAVSQFKKRILHECSCFLNLLNKLGKRNKMRGLQSILSLFRNKFNKFNYTRL